MHGPHIITTGSPTPATSRPVAAPTSSRGTGRTAHKPDEGGAARILNYVRLHWLMILFCGTLLGAAGAFAAWELLASRYESYALLQVSSVPATVANQGNPNQARTDFVTYLKTTSALIKSEFVLTVALRDIKDLPTIKAQKDPIKFLDEELLVTWQDGSEVIRVTFKSHESADAKKIVDAVQAAFMKEVVQKDTLEKQIFLKKVEDAQLEMRRILDRKTDRRDNTRNVVPAVPGAPNNDATTSDPANPKPPAPLPPITTAGGVLPPPPAVVQASGWGAIAAMDPRVLVNRITGLMQEAERLPLAINDGKRRLAVLQAKLDAAKDAEPSALVMEAVERDQAVITQILKTKQAHREYEFKKNAGSSNAPGVVQLRQIWESHEARLVQLRKDKAIAMEQAMRFDDARKIATEMEELIRFLQRQQEQLDLVKAQLTQAEKQFSELPPPVEKGSGIVLAAGQEPIGYEPEASALDSTDGIYRGLVRQYYLTQMELNSPNRVRVLQQGSNPTRKEVKKQVMGTVFAGLMGFAVIALGVVGFETVTKRVSSLADVKTSTSFPIVGVIPCLPTEAVRDPARRAAAHEAIDRLRAHMAQAWLARGATTVAVTSALGDEGKAFTAFGLASSLAQSGYRTLVVDFDLRDPQLHQLADVPNDAGVCELLRGETDPRSVLMALPSGLQIIPAGKWSDEARKAATGERLESLLKRLKASYDCVVIHGHALLTAAESVEVARRCDVTLICALYRDTTMPLLKKAAERIAAMEIPFSGVVYVGATGHEALC